MSVFMPAPVAMAFHLIIHGDVRAHESTTLESVTTADAHDAETARKMPKWARLCEGEWEPSARTSSCEGSGPEM